MIIRNYDYRNITEMRCYEKNLLEKTNKTLIDNFNKVAKWIECNCPNLNGEFKCYHQVYHWTKLVIENGKAYLEYGSHGYDFEIALSTTETALFTRGSMQGRAIAYKLQFFRNDALEEFLTQWSHIKDSVIIKNAVQNKVFSSDFQP